jgi:hypothetical protein
MNFENKKNKAGITGYKYKMSSSLKYNLNITLLANKTVCSITQDKPNSETKLKHFDKNAITKPFFNNPDCNGKDTNE